MNLYALMIGPKDSRHLMQRGNGNGPWLFTSLYDAQSTAADVHPPNPEIVAVSVDLCRKLYPYDFIMVTRKDKIEMVTKFGMSLTNQAEAANAWHRLMSELVAMSEPEARSPRFSGLLRSIWAAATNEQS